MKKEQYRKIFLSRQVTVLKLQEALETLTSTSSTFGDEYNFVIEIIGENEALKGENEALKGENYILRELLKVEKEKEPSRVPSQNRRG